MGLGRDAAALVRLPSQGSHLDGPRAARADPRRCRAVAIRRHMAGTGDPASAALAVGWPTWLVRRPSWNEACRGLPFRQSRISPGRALLRAGLGSDLRRLPLVRDCLL